MARKKIEAAPLTEDEKAALVAAGEPIPDEPVEESEPDPIKDWFRANIGWVMAEMDYHRMGHSAKERAKSNP